MIAITTVEGKTFFYNTSWLQELNNLTPKQLQFLKLLHNIKIHLIPDHRQLKLACLAKLAKDKRMTLAESRAILATMNPHLRQIVVEHFNITDAKPTFKELMAATFKLCTGACNAQNNDEHLSSGE
jgi:hypothetical protein